MAAMRRRVEQSRARLNLLQRRPVYPDAGGICAKGGNEWTTRRSGRIGTSAMSWNDNPAALATAVGKLDALSPLATLARGYAVPRRADTGEVVRRGNEVAPGDGCSVRLHDASYIRSCGTSNVGRPGGPRDAEARTGGAADRRRTSLIDEVRWGSARPGRWRNKS